VTSLVYTINNSTFAGFIPAGVQGLKAAYPNILDSWYESNINPSKRAVFENAASQCAAQDLQEYSGQDIGTYFKLGLAGSLSQPEPKAVLALSGLMGQHGLPQIPLYVYKSLGDEISPAVDTDTLVNQYCGQGIKSLQYYRNAVGEHFTEAILGSVGAVAFLRERFEGLPAYAGCDIQTVAISRLDDPGNELEGLVDELVAVLKSLLLLPLGRL
jgi:hypothetical protein